MAEDVKASGAQASGVKALAAAEPTVTYDNGSSKWNADFSENYALIEKIAKQTIYNVTSTNPLDWINKGDIANGVAIEDALVELAESYEWISEKQTGANLNAPAYPKIHVQYHSTWNGRQFKTTVSEDQIRKVLLSGGDESDIAAKVVANLTESEGYEDYVNCKGALAAGRGVNILPVDDTTYSADTTLLKKIKDVCDQMTFVNTAFNAASLTGRTPFDRIRIVMSYNLMNAIDVDIMASMFNMDRAALNARVTLIDDPGYVYIVDEYGIFKYTRLYRMTSKYVEDGLYSNYWLTIDRMFGTNDLFKMAYIKTEI